MFSLETLYEKSHFKNVTIARETTFPLVGSVILNKPSNSIKTKSKIKPNE